MESKQEGRVSINGRTKGHGFERYIVNKLKQFFPNAERVKCGDSLDLKGVDIRGAGRLHIQAKRNRNYAPIGKIEEIKTEGGIPILWTKGDRRRPIVCMYEDDFLEIINNNGVIYERHN